MLLKNSIFNEQNHQVLQHLMVSNKHINLPYMNTTTNVSNNPITTNLSIENLPNEIWKPIKGYEGLYEISSLGRVKSFKRIKTRILKLCNSNGYLSVSLIDKNKVYKTFKIHRLVAINFIDNPENKEQVNHKNGIKSDNNLHNLEWCTPSENQIHANKTGLSNPPKGEKHHKSKLTEPEVRWILQNYQKGLGKVFAEKFKVSRNQIILIINKKAWKHV